MKRKGCDKPCQRCPLVVARFSVVDRAPVVMALALASNLAFSLMP